jgi:hypothetical protein
MEANAGTSTLSDENDASMDRANNTRPDEGQVQELNELPIAGLGEDFINEVYQLDEEGKDKYVIIRQEDQLRNSLLKNTKNNNNLPLPTTAEVVREKTASKLTGEVGEDIHEVLQALRGLIQILNTTSQGKTGPRLRKKRPPLAPASHQIKDLILNSDTFSRIQSVHMPGADTPVLLSSKHVLPPPIISYENSNEETRVNSSNNTTTEKRASTTTIPPYLIPLGPDGRPLLRPDGSLVNADGHHVTDQQQQQLSQMFPYLSAMQDSPSESTTPAAPATTERPVNSTQDELSNSKNNTTKKSSSDEKDMITSMIDTVRDLPMDTKRHMLANMMFGVPMAAITMAAAGVPHLAIAPLATLIPGFLFAAFTDTNPAPRTDGHRHGHGGHGHGHGGHGHDGAENREGQSNIGHPPQQGLGGLIAGLRQFYTNRRENQTLHIFTDNSHRQHGK